MSGIRIGTASLEPPIGNIKVGSDNVQEIYIGSDKIWPTVSPGADDPYTPIPDGNPVFIGTEFTSGDYNATSNISLYNQTGNVVESLGVVPYITSPTRTAYYVVTSASDNCQHILMKPFGDFNGKLIKSNDRGATWQQTVIYNARSNTGCSLSLAQSRNGKYIVTCELNNNQPGVPNDPQISSDFGENFTPINLPNYPSAAPFSAQCGLSAGGKYIYITYKADLPSSQSFITVQRSDDYGQSFTDISSSLNLPNISTPTDAYFFWQPLVSATGNKVSFVSGWYNNGSANTQNSPYGGKTSNDYGISYTDIINPIKYFPTLHDNGICRNIDANGDRYIWPTGNNGRYFTYYDSSFQSSPLLSQNYNRTSLASVSNYGSYGLLTGTGYPSTQGYRTGYRVFLSNFQGSTSQIINQSINQNFAPQKFHLAVNVL